MSGPDAGETGAAQRCACGTELAPTFLACPVCHRLVHAERLGHLVADAERLEAEGRLRDGLLRLREALDLLPAATRQHAVLAQRAARLSDAIDRGEDRSGDPASTGGHAPLSTAPTPSEPPPGARPLWRIGAAAGGLGLLLWKFKFAVVFLASKAKLLLLGLGKSTTLLTMFASLAVYWTIWGWAFALGIVLSIYVHEMGHVAALRRFGIPASAPMFVPGLGALVRMDRYPQTLREDARVGLAGPVYGLACATVVACAGLATGEPLLAAIASVGAWINLFNLIPIWQLDGSRGLRALSRGGRVAIAALAAACAFVFDEGLFVAIAGVAGLRGLTGDAPEGSDRRALIELAVLLVGLGLLAALPVHTDVAG